MKNQLREKLYAGETSLGTWITIGSPDVTDTLKQLDFDWFVLDTEHSYYSIETARNLMLSLTDSKVVPIVRVGENDQYLIKRALDIGSYGVLVPLVNTREEAERVSELQQISSPRDPGRRPS